ncbi:MAG: tetratricopeptide repeat protein [Phycisphaerae bacterium]
MAEEQIPNTAAPPTTSDSDKSKARQWFKKANDCRQKREYDYAVECYLSGLGFWPDAVEDGLMPLGSLALQRQQAGGKPPGMMEKMKRSTSGKDVKQNLLNALWLWVKDPKGYEHTEAALKNALKLGYLEIVKFIAPKALDLLKQEKKPSPARFKILRQTLLDAAERAELLGQVEMQVWLLDQATTSLEFLRSRIPDDADLRNEHRDVSSKLTIARGKYSEAESFRSSLKDAEKQTVLHDTDRVKQGEQTFETLLAAARNELAEHPTLTAKVFGLVDLLCRRERKDDEDEAIQLLARYYAESKNYSYKMRADDIRLRQLARTTRELLTEAKRTGSEDDKRNARLAAMDQLETEIEIQRERMSNYPTDLRIKFRYAQALFRAKRYDDAIPALQAAQADPRNRVQCLLLMGRCFYEKQQPTPAREVIQEALDAYELTGDDTHKELLYHLAQAYEAEGNATEAAATLGKLVRVDYNYAGGAARERLEKLSKTG